VTAWEAFLRGWRQGVREDVRALPDADVVAAELGADWWNGYQGGRHQVAASRARRHATAAPETLTQCNGCGGRVILVEGPGIVVGCPLCVAGQVYAAQAAVHPACGGFR
jgi:hypothetical protein